MTKKLDLVGQKFNRLTVLETVDAINKRTAWRCKCDCGNIKIVKTECLKSGDSKSCGCLNNEQRSKNIKNVQSKNAKYSPIEASARNVWRVSYKEMPFDDFYYLSQLNCHYCGESPSNRQNSATKASSANRKENGYFIYNGLDRINNNQPHSKENCVPCCKYCNYSKRERSTEDFKNWIIKAYTHFISYK